MAKLFEKIDDNPGSYFGMLVEKFEDKKETLKESRTVDYLELDLAEKSGDEDVYNAYDENELTIVKDGNVWYFEHCPYGLDKKVKKLMKKYYPELTYLYESLKEDSEYKTLAKLSKGLEVISYPYGYAVSDGYVVDRFVVRDGKYILDDGRFRLSDKDKQKILSLINKGVIEESLKESIDNYKVVYCGNGKNEYTEKEAIELAKYKGFKNIAWVSEGRNFSGNYNGDSWLLFNETENLPDGVKQDAEEYGKSIGESLKEDKFVPKDKMSKKAQKELNDKKRGTWGNTNPVTRVQPNKKAYDRKRDKKELDEELTEDSEIFKDMSNALDDIEYLCKDTYNWETSDWNNKENIKRTAERIIESAQVLLDSIKKY